MLEVARLKELGLVRVSVVAGGTAFLVAGALVPLLVGFAVGRNLLDAPNLRSSHEVPTPEARWGRDSARDLGRVLHSSSRRDMAAARGGNPHRSRRSRGRSLDLHFGAKAAAQTLVAAGLLLLYPPEISPKPQGPGVSRALAVGVLWIVALSNAFNFMDGIDGFIGVAIVNAFFLLALTGEAFLVALIGASAGFLIWNINPASIFLGDSGAYFLGFGLAAVALYAPVPGGGWTPVGFVAGVLVFTPLLFDTAYTLVRRLQTGAGKNIFSAHREHIYQRITPTTAMHRRTSNLYYGAGVIAGFRGRCW